MTKRIIALLFGLSLFTSSCGQKPEIPDGFKVALLSPGPISDQGWNAIAYEGLLQIKTKLGAHIAQTETKTPLDFEEGFRHFASQNYDLIFGHGFEFQDAAATVAPDFPNTIFVTSSGNTVRSNVAAMLFKLEDAAYLMGYLAGKMSKTGKAGMIGGVELPALQSSFIAFKKGAKDARPDMEISEIFLGNWEDVAGAREATVTLIEKGCDFLIHNADAAGLGVFQAAKEKGTAYVFGTNKNQNNLAPEVVMASGVIDIPKGFLRVAEQVKNGTFKPEVLYLGMPEGIVTLEFNEKLEALIPKNIRQEIRVLEEQIRSRKLVLDVSYD